jgi:hypothetical protein
VISVDGPTDGQTAVLGQDVVFTGWAAHSGGPGTGVDRVIVLDAPVGAGGQQVAQAQYGLARADVGEKYGPAWTNSDFKATWKATGSAGNRTFWIYAHSVADDGWTNKTVTVMLTQGPQGAPPTTTGGQYASPSSSTSYGGQYGSQSGAQYTPQSGQYSAPQYGAPTSGSYSAPQYGPGSPNGAVPVAPFSSGSIGLGNGSGYAGAPPFGMYGGGSYAGGGYPYGGGSYPYGGYGAASQFGMYGAGSYGAAGYPYAGYGGAPPAGMYGGGAYGGAYPYAGNGGSQFYGGYPSPMGNCAGGGSPYGGGVPYSASYAAYGNGNYYAGSAC